LRIPIQIGKFNRSGAEATQLRISSAFEALDLAVKSGSVSAKALATPVAQTNGSDSALGEFMSRLQKNLASQKRQQQQQQQNVAQSSESRDSATNANGNQFSRRLHALLFNASV
uniref:Type III effector HopAS1 n=1 Tax=Macrostomum lignano TaxID=282301 RepID=A0A1I8IV74_9PLAT